MEYAYTAKKSLRAIRKMKGFTAKAISEKLNFNYSEYTSFERGRRRYRINKINKINEFLGIKNIADFFDKHEMSKYAPYSPCSKRGYRNNIYLTHQARVIRNSLKLSVDEVGEKLGCHPHFVYFLERGDRSINKEFLQKLEVLYGVNASLFSTARNSKKEINKELKDLTYKN